MGHGLGMMPQHTLWKSPVCCGELPALGALISLNTIVEQQKAHFDEAMTSLRAGDARQAASVCDAALREFPGDANLLCLAAKASLALKDVNAAEARVNEALKLFPEFAVAHDVNGDVLLMQGQPDSAIRSWEQAMRLDPTRGALPAKIEHARQLKARVAQAPPAPRPEGRRMAFEDEINKATELQKNGEPAQAEKIYRDILKRDPEHVEAARLMAGIAMEHKKPDEAEVFLRHALKKAPDYGRLWIDLCNVLRERELLNEALECAAKVLELAPDKAESHILYGSVVGLLGRHDEAIEYYEKALEISPERAGVMCSMAHHLKTVGRQDDGIAMYRKAIETKADQAEAYWSLANLKTFSFEQYEIDAMHALLADDELPDESRVQIHNALGLAAEGDKDYDEAFSQFEQCNMLRRQAESYDPVETETGYDDIIEIMNETFIAEREGLGHDDPSPILVVGLPRSGSTLIEQILASHSQVDGTHELGDLPNVAQRIRRFSPTNAKFPGNLFDVPEDGWQRIGEEYVTSTMKFRAGAPFFIDKNPNNFIFVGLLKIALPNAKIINAMRHPMDSCFGTYKQLFASGQPFSYDLTEVGEYYLQYRRLMDHWEKVAPGYVLDVRYEEVVADLESQVRRLLDFCGLPFEEGCLEFYNTERAVKTASSEQVRRPIYSTSVNLWKHYEHRLGELIEVLEPALAEY